MTTIRGQIIWQSGPSYLEWHTPRNNQDIHYPNSSARNSRAFAAWGALIINLIHSYDPETIIFGSGLIKSTDVVVPALQSIVDEQATMPGGRASLKAVSLGDAAALLGIE